MGIPNKYKVNKFALSENLNTTIFIPEGQNYAHNQMNFGIFFWGASGFMLGRSETTLKLAAHINSLIFGGNGYDR